MRVEMKHWVTFRASDFQIKQNEDLRGVLVTVEGYNTNAMRARVERALGDSIGRPVLVASFKSTVHER